MGREGWEEGSVKFWCWEKWKEKEGGREVYNKVKEGGRGSVRKGEGKEKREESGVV